MRSQRRLPLLAGAAGAPAVARVGTPASFRLVASYLLGGALRWIAATVALTRAGCVRTITVSSPSLQLTEST